MTKKTALFFVVGLIVLSLTQTLFSASFEDEYKKVKDAIARVELGIYRYKVVNSVYPADGNRNLVSSLSSDYITFEPQIIKNGLLIDPWGHSYIYQRYDQGDNLRWHTYVIYSIGPNGIDENGRGDDIGNW